MKAYMRLGWGLGAGDTLSWGRSTPCTAGKYYVHRDDIGEIDSSVLLNGVQKLQITRLFSIPFIITTNERVHEGFCGGTLYPGVDRPPPPLPQVNSNYVHRDEI